MTLNLTEQERVALKELLETKVQDLRMEISHTDKPDYKDSLKARKETLKSILAKLS